MLDPTDGPTARSRSPTFRSRLLMVHRAAPLRLTGAFAATLLIVGGVPIARSAVASDPAFARVGAAGTLAIGALVLHRRNRLTFEQVGRLAVASTVLVTVTIAARDTPYG